jgi:hypothetical protein
MVLMLALLATIVAIFYPMDEPVILTAARITKPNPAIHVVAAPAVDRQEQGRPLWIASDENPFGPRAWVAPLPAPVEAARAVQAVELAQAAPEPPPAPLPYRFLGRMQDGANQVLYLGRGDQVLLAHQGDVLEGSYKVVAVSDGMIEFESVQSGLKQSLPIPVQ